jgi:hypothetical protein
MNVFFILRQHAWVGPYPTKDASSQQRNRHRSICTRIRRVAQIVARQPHMSLWHVNSRIIALRKHLDHIPWQSHDTLGHSFRRFYRRYSKHYISPLPHSTQSMRTLVCHHPIVMCIQCRQHGFSRRLPRDTTDRNTCVMNRRHVCCEQVNSTRSLDNIEPNVHSVSKHAT